MTKKVLKPLASAGDADPGQGGIWEVNPKQAEIYHAVAHPPDGRADCLRFASPAEALSPKGLEAQRLRDQELKNDIR